MKVGESQALQVSAGYNEAMGMSCVDHCLKQSRINLNPDVLIQIFITTLSHSTRSSPYIYKDQSGYIAHDS